MRPERKKVINELAAEIRQQLNLTGLPYDVEGAIQQLGGTIEYGSFPFEGDATVEKIGEAFRITLNERISTSRERERFTLAHELGHLFLHMGFLVDDEKWQSTGPYEDTVYARYGTGIKEYEANEFAAAFLMPAEEFKQEAKENASLNGGRVKLQDLAKIFDVSTIAIRNRGRWLGLFSWD